MYESNIEKRQEIQNLFLRESEHSNITANKLDKSINLIITNIHIESNLKISWTDYDLEIGELTCLNQSINLYSINNKFYIKIARFKETFQASLK